MHEGDALPNPATTNAGMCWVGSRVSLHVEGRYCGSSSSMAGPRVVGGQQQGPLGQFARPIHLRRDERVHSRPRHRPSVDEQCSALFNFNSLRRLCIEKRVFFAPWTPTFPAR